MLSGFAAFVYVAALWFIAPAFLRGGASVADRLRLVIAVGVIVPGALGLVQVLYAPVLWLAVAALVVLRVRRRDGPVMRADAAVYALFGALLIVVWPPLVRPLLDGDTLLYHLPNAVAFVQAHSIWVTRAPYWLYPPAAEVFASGLFAASGRWSLPLAGVLPALLIAARLYAVARENGASRFAAAGVPLAFICTPVAAFQTGTLQNDLWLAAFFVEALAAERPAISLGIAALLKPYGWVVSVLAAAATRVSWRTLAIAFVPLVIWAVRDAVLISAGASLGFTPPQYFPTTIAGNFTAALPQLAHGIATVTPQGFFWIAMLIAGLAFSATRHLAAAGVAALVLYVFLPVSYSDGGATNYVLDASSFRYALPALAAGALAAAVLMKRSGVYGAVLSYGLAVWGAWNVLAVFWNDSYTHWAFAAAAIVVFSALVSRQTRGASIAAAALAVMLVASWGASSRAQGFYGDWMRQPSGKPTGVFAWISAHAPRRVLAENVRTGAVLMSSPATWIAVAPAVNACSDARREHAMLLVGSNEGLRGLELARAMASARSCGSTVYEDGAAVLVQLP